MLPFNADNLQDDEAPAPVEEADHVDATTGEEVAPTLSDDAVETLDHLAEHQGDPIERAAETTTS